MRFKALLAVGLLVAAAACTEDIVSPVEPQLSGQADAEVDREPRTYQVKVWNLSGGQPFTPPLVALHNRNVRLFRPGRPASNEVQQIAENGNLQPMIDMLEGSDDVTAFMVAEGPTIPPLLPGENTYFEITGGPDANFVSMISMLICTNDGFTGVSRVRLPRRIGEIREWSSRAYDAGTEINTEDFDDLVPPCAPLTGVMTDKMGTGMSNPDLAEGERVRRHRGIRGHADLDPAIHGWRGGVLQFAVKRIS